MLAIAKSSMTSPRVSLGGLRLLSTDNGAVQSAIDRTRTSPGMTRVIPVNESCELFFVPLKGQEIQLAALEAALDKVATGAAEARMAGPRLAYPKVTSHLGPPSVVGAVTTADLPLVRDWATALGRVMTAHVLRDEGEVDLRRKSRMTRRACEVLAEVLATSSGLRDLGVGTLLLVLHPGLTPLPRRQRLKLRKRQEKAANKGSA